MDLRTRSVDLVEEKSGEPLTMTQQRPGLDAWLALGIDVGVVDKISWHEIDRALDPLEFTADRSRERTQNRGLAHTDVTLQEHMPAGKQRDVDEPHGSLLTENRFPYFFFQKQRPGAPVMELLGRDHHGLPQGNEVQPRPMYGIFVAITVMN